MSKFVLPYEPQYTGHRDAKKQHKDVRDSLRRNPRETTSPSLVPEPAREDDKTK